jgi:tartronate-semialdehyde synthase
VFREAFRIARSGRPGPVLIDLPLDVQKGLCRYDRRWTPRSRSTCRFRAAEPVRAAVRMLLEAERPLILAGGGVIGGEAGAELRELAEHLQVPVQVTLMGKGAFPEDHPLFAGMAGIQTQTRWGNRAFLESDWCWPSAPGSATGTPATWRSTGAGGGSCTSTSSRPRSAGLRARPRDHRARRPALAALPSRRRPGRGPARRGMAGPRRAPARHPRAPRRLHDVPIKPPRVYRELNEHFARTPLRHRDRALPDLVGSVPAHLPAAHYLVCGQAGPLGWEVPAAIGVKCAFPQRPVVAVVGDYSFQFLMEEIAVAAQYRIPFVIVMVNNEYLGLIRQAELPYDMNYAVDLHYGEGGIDHVKLMEAFGCPRAASSGRRTSPTPWPGRRPSPRPSSSRCWSRSWSSGGQRRDGPVPGRHHRVLAPSAIRGT